MDIYTFNTELNNYIEKKHIPEQVSNMLKRPSVRKIIESERTRFINELNGKTMNEYRPDYNLVLDNEPAFFDSEDFKRLIIIVCGVMMKYSGNETIAMRDAIRKAVNLELFALYIALENARRKGVRAEDVKVVDLGVNVMFIMEL